MYSVQCENISLIYKNGLQALYNICFAFNPGNIVAYLGPNGAGKTTTIKILSTSLSPSEGSAFICGYNVVNQKQEVRKKIGLSQQDLALDPMITVMDNLVIFGELQGLYGKKLKNRINYMLEEMDINDKKYSPLYELSSGQTRKVQLIRELLQPPEVLFLDEPTAGLDILSAQSLLKKLKKISIKGKTIFIASHRMELLESICTHVLFLNKGKVIASGRKEEFIKQFSKQVKVSFNIEQQDKKNVLLLLKRAIPESVCIPSQELKLLLPDDKKSMSLLLKTLAEQKIRFENLLVKPPSLEDAWLNIFCENRRE